MQKAQKFWMISIIVSTIRDSTYSGSLQSIIAHHYYKWIRYSTYSWYLLSKIANDFYGFYSGSPQSIRLHIIIISEWEIALIIYACYLR